MAGTFNPEKHEYRIDGRIVPSVTQVVRRFVPLSWDIDPWYAERGRMVHQACALLVQSRLDWASIDPRIEGYVRAAEKWVKLHWQSGTANIEIPLYDKSGLFAGTPDIVLNGLVIDWKTYDDPAVFLQCGGYCLLSKSREAVSIELCAHGGYRETGHNVKRSTGLFRAALSLYQWYESKGMNKQGSEEGNGRE